MPTAASSCVPEITDTEEVTGSNPVSPTSITPGQTGFATASMPAIAARASLAGDKAGLGRLLSWLLWLRSSIVSVLV
jgi:hypothetical protein